MNPCELTAAITTFANILSTDMSVDELNLWGSVFSQLGDTLTTIAAQISICNNSNNTPEP